MNFSLRRAEGDDWNQTVASLSGAHILQTREWAEVKSRYGWQSNQYYWQAEGDSIVAAALILRRSISIPGLRERLGVLYVPKGPVLDWRNLELRHRVFSDLVNIARQRGAIFIKIDPDVNIGIGVPGGDGFEGDSDGVAIMDEMQKRGWRFSDEQIQFRNTIQINLRENEETLLANMKQKARYNIRLAVRKGVKVRLGRDEDLSTLYRMYAETALRDGFVIRDEGYYLGLWNTFIRAGMAQPLVAEVEGNLVAAVIIFRFAGVAWYLYGMSKLDHREKMPNYLLQWEAILHAKAHDCQIYDLWGAPDIFSDSDPMWGVYRFKSGLGGKVVGHIGAWDMPVRPSIYRVYTQILPKVLNYMRRRGTTRMERTLV